MVEKGDAAQRRANRPDWTPKTSRRQRLAEGAHNLMGIRHRRQVMDQADGTVIQQRPQQDERLFQFYEAPRCRN